VFLSRETEYVLAALMAVVFGLSMLSRRFPDVAWLRPFQPPKLTPRQQATHRRRANTYAGLEMILIGVLIPMGYVAMTVMTFNNFDTTTTVLVIGGSLVCIGLGITAIVRSQRD
jgi:hypothetical protein